MRQPAKILTAFGIFLLLGFAFFAGKASLFDFGKTASTSDKSNSQIAALVAGSEEKFDYLYQERSNSCGLQPTTVLGYSADTRIQGSCCSPMDLHRYQEQVETLKQYSNISFIPEDPYDISAPLAKELLGYQQNMTLTTEQQEIYDKAVELSPEGGPCCCKCWRWYAFEGMGKKLITDYDWSSEELAELWSLTDGCGGADHEHG